MPLTSIIWVIHNKHYLGHPHCTHSPPPTWGAHHYHHPHMGLGQYSAVKKEVAQCRSFTSPTASTPHPNGIPLWHSPTTIHAFWFLGMGVNIVGCPICSMDITTLGTHHLAVEPCSLFPLYIATAHIHCLGPCWHSSHPQLAPVYWQLGPLPNYN